MTDMTATALTALSQSIAAAVGGAAPHLVAVHSHHARASGFVWRPGLIVTAEEALADDGEVSVQAQGGPPITATRVGGRSNEAPLVQECLPHQVDRMIP